MHGGLSFGQVMSPPSKSVKCYSKDDDNNELRRGPWTLEEDEVLIKHIANHGEGRWNLVALSSGLRRTGKSCRLRWLNYLKPDIKRGNLTSQEQLLIFELHSKWGNRWSRIAQHLPGRTDNEIKNFWRTRIQKQARHSRMITCIEKVSSSTSTMSIQNQSLPFPLDGVSHYSTIRGSNYLDQFEMNPDSEHNNGLCMSSSESANIPNMTQPLEYTSSTSQFQALDNNSDFGISTNEEYHINNNTYEIDALNLTTTSDCQISESNWLDEQFSCSMWNMNELWQVRKMQS